MNRTNNKLILFLAILSFVFGFSLTTPAYANRGGGIPFYLPNDYPETTQYPSNYYSVPVYTPVYKPVYYDYNVPNDNTTTQIAPTVKNPTNTVSKTASKNTVATTSDINENYGSLAANALFGSNSFMPNGLIQWIFFIILITAIIFLWRYVHRSKDIYMSEPLKHA